MAVLTIPATAFLIVMGLDSVWKIVSFSIYGSVMFLLYTFSTLYHWLPSKAGQRYQVFRKLDHLTIYAFIAATYTPFCLVTLRGPWGWSLFGIVWGLALIGISIQAIFINAPRWLTTSVYLGLGWVVIIALRPLFLALSTLGIGLLASGGVVYSIGGIIYVIKRPNLFPGFGFHELWHVAVMIGSSLHYLALLLAVA